LRHRQHLGIAGAEIGFTKKRKEVLSEQTTPLGGDTTGLANLYLNPLDQGLFLKRGQVSRLGIK
jgi:hypothetical protein